MLKTNANCHSGCASSNRYSMGRPSCQLKTSGIGPLSPGRLPYELDDPPLAERLVCVVGAAVEREAEHLQDPLRGPPHQRVLLDEGAGHGVEPRMVDRPIEHHAHDLHRVLGRRFLHRHAFLTKPPARDLRRVSCAFTVFSGAMTGACLILMTSWG